MNIPRIIHQTWKNNDVPASFQELATTWKRLHPGWEYQFWTDEMNRNFIEEHYPAFLDIYDNYPANIQRVDAVRYFALYTYGGVYIDMDFECLQNITPLLEKADCVFGKEPADHCITHSKDIIICNAFMASIPQHPFFGSLCNELSKNITVTDHPFNNILETTGPFMLSRVYENYPARETVSLLEAEILYPLTQKELQEDGPDLSQKLSQAYAIHHYAGTWWKKKPSI